MAERLGLTWHTDVDQRMATPEQRRRAGARSPSASPTPRRWRWPTPTPRSPPTASTASRCRCCRSPDRTAAETVVGRAGRQGRGAPVHARRSARPVARAAADAARCVTGYGAAPRRLRRLVHRARRVRRGRASGRRQDRHHRRHPGGLVRRVHPGSWPAASFIADPDNPHDVAGDWNHWKPIQTVTDTIRAALRGSPVRYFTPPPPSAVGTPQRVSAPKPAAGPPA